MEQQVDFNNIYCLSFRFFLWIISQLKNIKHGVHVQIVSNFTVTGNILREGWFGGSLFLTLNTWVQIGWMGGCSKIHLAFAVVHAIVVTKNYC